MRVELRAARAALCVGAAAQRQLRWPVRRRLSWPVRASASGAFRSGLRPSLHAPLADGGAFTPLLEGTPAVGVEGGVAAQSTDDLSAMPNLHATDRQARLYITSRSRHQNQESAAASAGFGARTARRLYNDPRSPSQTKQPRSWRTRADPLTDIWLRVLERLDIPGVMAVTIFARLQDELGLEVRPIASGARWSVASPTDARFTVKTTRFSSLSAVIPAVRRGPISPSPSPARLSSTASIVFGWRAAAGSLRGRSSAAKAFQPSPPYWARRPFVCPQGSSRDRRPVRTHRALIRTAQHRHRRQSSLLSLEPGFPRRRHDCGGRRQIGPSRGDHRNER